MPVVAWTVDEQSEMVTLIQMGVDGIITNVPGEALGYVTEFIAGNSASSDDQFSVSDMVWVALGSAGSLSLPCSVRTLYAVSPCLLRGRSNLGRLSSRAVGLL